MSEMSCHGWDCQRAKSPVSWRWLWAVHRDRKLVGFLRTTASRFLAADQPYEVLNAQGHPVTNVLSYNEALTALHAAVPLGQEGQ